MAGTSPAMTENGMKVRILPLDIGHFDQFMIPLSIFRNSPFGKTQFVLPSSGGLPPISTCRARAAFVLPGSEDNFLERHNLRSVGERVRRIF
jgi:hypothetical protein